MDRAALMADVRTQLLRRAQSVLDKTTPHPLARWLALAALLALYALRVWRLDGWFIVTYGLAIFMLNLFIGFISPQVDPDSDAGGGAVLPIAGGRGSGGGGGGGGGLDASESKGFARKVPEFTFWFSATRATFIAFAMTFFVSAPSRCAALRRALRRPEATWPARRRDLARARTLSPSPHARRLVCSLAGALQPARFLADSRGLFRRVARRDAAQATGAHGQAPIHAVLVGQANLQGRQGARRRDGRRRRRGGGGEGREQLRACTRP